jgi:hypothetical protein
VHAEAEQHCCRSQARVLGCSAASLSVASLPVQHLRLQYRKIYMVIVVQSFGPFVTFCIQGMANKHIYAYKHNLKIIPKNICLKKMFLGGLYA